MLGKCVGYAISLLEEKGASHIILKGMGRAIRKTVTIAEMIKRRFPGLHQNTEIGSGDINTIWEPLEEDLSTLEMTREGQRAWAWAWAWSTGTSEEHVATLSSQNTTDNSSLDNGWIQVRGRRGGRGRGRGRAIGGAGNFASLGHQNVDTVRYHSSSANGWNQGRGCGRGNYSHYNVWNQGRGGRPWQLIK
eukprot:PITA_33114